MDVVTLIKDEMKKQNLSPYYLGLKAGLDPAGIHRMVYGNNNKRPAFSTAIKCLRALNIPMSKIEELEI